MPQSHVGLLTLLRASRSKGRRVHLVWTYGLLLYTRQRAVGTDASCFRSGTAGWPEPERSAGSAKSDHCRAGCTVAHGCRPSGHDPEAIVLDLVQPEPAGWRFGCFGWKARRDEAGRENATRFEHGRAS